MQEDARARLEYAVREMLVCPACRRGLVLTEEPAVHCTGCRRTFPIVDGLPVLLVERARQD